MRHGEGTIVVVDLDSNEQRFFSRHLMCPTTGISYNEPAPHSFSFNSPQGACPRCNGLGTVTEAHVEALIPDPSISIKKGGIKPLGAYKSTLIFWQLDAIAGKYGFSLEDPIEEIPEEAINIILYGSEEPFRVKSPVQGVNTTYQMSFAGILDYLGGSEEELPSRAKNGAESYLRYTTCPECNGARLRKEVLFFKLPKRILQSLVAWI